MSAHPRRTSPWPGHPCMYDWKPERRGEVLECIIHPKHGGQSAVVIRRTSPEDDPLIELARVGLLRGQALTDAEELLGKVVITADDIPF
jgi:hypothetical protein